VTPLSSRHTLEAESEGRICSLRAVRGRKKRRKEKKRKKEGRETRLRVPALNDPTFKIGFVIPLHRLLGKKKKREKGKEKRR